MAENAPETNENNSNLRWDKPLDERRKVCSEALQKAKSPRKKEFELICTALEETRELSIEIKDDPAKIAVVTNELENRGLKVRVDTSVPALCVKLLMEQGELPKSASYYARIVSNSLQTDFEDKKFVDWVRSLKDDHKGVLKDAYDLGREKTDGRQLKLDQAAMEAQLRNTESQGEMELPEGFDIGNDQLGLLLVLGIGQDQVAMIDYTVDAKSIKTVMRNIYERNDHQLVNGDSALDLPQRDDGEQSDNVPLVQ